MKPDIRTNRGSGDRESLSEFYPRDLQPQELTLSNSGSSSHNLLIPPSLTESDAGARTRVYEGAAAEPPPLLGLRQPTGDPLV